jgi:hypothetical protein
MPSPKRANYNNNQSYENARANYNRKGKRSANKSPPRTLTSSIGHLNAVLNQLSLKNLYALRLTSPAMRNKINASGIIATKIPAALRARVQNRGRALAANTTFKYLYAPLWREKMFPELRMGLHPTVASSSQTQTHRRMGEHIRNFAGRTSRGVLPRAHKTTYAIWAQEHNQGRPYVPNMRNKQAVARALVAAYRRRKAARARR